MQNKLKIIPVVLLAGILMLIFTTGVFAKEHPGQVSKLNRLQTPEQGKIYRTLSNLCNWAYWIQWDGRSAHTPSDNSGGFYPRGTTTAIFTDGLVWGGYVSDGRVNNPAIGGVTYNVGTVGGWIVTPGAGDSPPVAVAKTDPRVMIYRIRADWQTLTINDPGVRQDAAELAEADVNEVTDAQAQAVIDDYAWCWNNWPGDKGAPYYDTNGNGTWDAGVDEPGLANADQVIWMATNDLDEAACEGLYGSSPIGIEQQMTMWSYNQPGATLGQLIFKKYTLINKSGHDIDSMFVSQWSDPDVGIYTDDLAGCDISRSLGYAYSGYLTDDYYTDFGLPPAAMGYDFFQGPLVDGVEGQDLNLNGVDDAVDYGIWNLKKVGPGKVNLPMTSFFYFSAGSAISDPPLADYNGSKQWYNMLNGYTPTNDLIIPTAFTIGNIAGGEPTKFPLSGDPFIGIGDVDATINNFSAADRRIGLCSGPFFMANGDTQEVVVAVVGGIVAEVGGNNVNAVEQMKINDDFAQFVYDNLFQALPKAPAAPKVKVTQLDNQVVLDWGSDSAAVVATEAPDPILGYTFEGYNVYQLPTATAAKAQATLVATYDAVNLVRTIRGKKFVASFGDIVEVPVQKGTDNGLQRYFILEKDYINDKPLYNGNTYYFAVTGFNYNPDPDVPERTLESGLTAILVTPQSPIPGTQYPNAPGDEVTVTKLTADPVPSTGSTEVMVVDPAAVTGHDYSVTFENNPQYTYSVDVETGDSSLIGTWYPWRLTDVTTGSVILADQRNQAGDLDYLITDGVIVKTIGPKAGGIAQEPTITGTRWIRGVNAGGSFFGGGLFEGLNFQGSTLGLGDLVPVRLEFQSATDIAANGYISKGAAFLRPGYAFEGIGELPIAAYDIVDEANPRRLNICFIEQNSPGDPDYSPPNLIWDMGWTGTEYPTASQDLGDGSREYLYIMKSSYNEGADYNDANPGRNGDVLYALWAQPRLTSDGLSVRPYGQGAFIFTIIANQPNTPDDSYTFSTQAVIANNTELMKAAAEKINVFPNPYYAYNPAEPDRFTTFVTFNHLPPKATVRIFNLAGVQVRKLEKNDATQFLRWNLRNERDIPVASGMYIVYIEMKDIGKEKVLKVMILQQQEQLKYY